MLNRNALRAEIVRNGLTQKDIAKIIGISEKTFILKMKKGVFGTDEAEAMIKALGITNPISIFFAEEVTCEVTS